MICPNRSVFGFSNRSGLIVLDSYGRCGCPESYSCLRFCIYENILSVCMFVQNCPSGGKTRSGARILLGPESWHGLSPAQKFGPRRYGSGGRCGECRQGGVRRPVLHAGSPGTNPRRHLLRRRENEPGDAGPLPPARVGEHHRQLDRLREHARHPGGPRRDVRRYLE